MSKNETRRSRPPSAGDRGTVEIDERCDAILAGLAQELPVGVWVVEAPSGQHVYANQAFFEILGQPARTDLPAMKCAGAYGFRTLRGDLYPEDQLPFVRSLASGRPIVLDDLVLHRPDGTRRNLRIEARPIVEHGTEPTHVVHAVVDVTREIEAACARSEREMRRIHALRMAEICRIARSRGRELDTALGVVRRAAAELRAREAGGWWTTQLARLELAVERAGRESRSLLTLTHSATGLYRPIEIDQLVLGAARELTGGPHAGGLSLDLGSTAGELVAEPGDLERLIVALATHVRAAVHPRSTVRVRTYDDVLDEGRAARAAAPSAGPYVVVELAAGAPAVGDRLAPREGPGRLREAGIGRELQLVVDNHGAAVELLEGDRCRTARLLLPTGRGGVPRVAARERAATVLLVDDDDALRSAVARELREVGFLVLTASDGVDGLEAYGACHDQVDVVVLDVQMPRLGGAGCLRAMREIDPAPGVVVVSGASLPPELEEAVRTGDVAFLPKPYDVDRLEALLLTRGARAARRGQQADAS